MSYLNNCNNLKLGLILTRNICKFDLEFRKTEDSGYQQKDSNNSVNKRIIKTF